MNPKTAAKWLTGVAVAVIVGLTASAAPSSADDDGPDWGERSGSFRIDTTWD